MVTIDTPAEVTDLTSSFAPLFSGGRLDTQKAQRAFNRVRAGLKDVKVVFVPSYLSELMLETSRVTTRFGADLMLTDQVAWLKSEGFNAEIAKINTQSSVATNAEVVRSLVRESDQPVCLIGHSKGGLDTLHFLLTAGEDELQRVACFISVQSPFGGSPIADLAAGNVAVRSFAKPALSVLGGSYESLRNLCVTDRAAYMKAHRDKIAEILSGLPHLAVASYTPAKWYAPGWPTTWWMRERGYDNDGLVPVVSALLPHGRAIILDELDHGAPMTKAPFIQQRYDRIALLQSTLALALSEDAVRTAMAG